MRGGEVSLSAGRTRPDRRPFNSVASLRRSAFLCAVLLWPLSDYLVREIEASPNVAVLLNDEIAGARGDQRLRSVVLRNRILDWTEEVPAAAVFILIGAAPRTAWLPPELERDERAFILTGSRVSSTSPVAKRLRSEQVCLAFRGRRRSSGRRTASRISRGRRFARDPRCR